MNLLSVKNLEMRFGNDPIFEDLEFGVDEGEKVALVGPNGVGKTTLFRILAGEIAPDDGTIAHRNDMRMAYLRQETQFDYGQTPREVVSEAMRDVRETIGEHEAVSDKLSDPDSADEDLETLIEQQHDLQQQIERLGGWNWEHRVDDLVDRLGITPWVDRPLDALSGGQRRRVALARVLLEHPDLALLDEPTNHLDPQTVEWLENWLLDFPGAIFFISHDRYFLEQVADRIIELDEHDGVFVHPPDYQTFIDRKLSRMEIRKRTMERKQKLAEDELDWLKRGVKSQGRDSKGRAEELEKFAKEADMIDYERQRVELELHANREFGVQILAGRGIHKSYGGLKVLDDANLTVVHGNKIGLLGPNGCGKTTMLKIMMGEERFDAGKIERGKKTDIAFMTQDYADFDPDKTVYEAFSASDYVWVGDTRHHKRKYLEKFQFSLDDQKKKVSTLSGGQIRRLQLAHLAGEDANLLILDEPTNDLDMLTTKALEDALREWEGCLILVSHDRYFLNRVCNVIVAFEDGDLNRYKGDYDNYKEIRDSRGTDGATTLRSESGRGASRSGGAGSGESRSGGGGSGESRSEESEELQPLGYREQQELERLEGEIAEAEERKEAVQEKLSDPDLYSDRPDEIESLNAELADLEEQLGRLYERWEELSLRDELA